MTLYISRRPAYSVHMMPMLRRLEMSDTVKAWHTMDAPSVAGDRTVGVSTGLSRAEAIRRLDEYGPNELPDRGGKPVVQILWEQFTSVLLVVLIAAAFISALLGDYQDMAAILAIVILNALLGFRQEYRAEKAIAALKQLAVPLVKVRRDNRIEEISSRELVPGDILLLEAGNIVPADARILESYSLRTQEAMLTGESEPVEKDAQALGTPDMPLGERRNMVYMGTNVSYGRGEAIVVATGLQTELGHMADLLQNVTRKPTPLQRRLDHLGRNLVRIALLLVGLVFLLGVLRGEDLRVLLLTAISLAVAAVPEGLPAVVTIALALGAQRMLRRNALIRTLPSVETLGSVTVICSDKTGTLTQNRMTVSVLDVAGQQIDLLPEMQGNEPVVYLQDRQSLTAHQQALALLLAGGALCNDAILVREDADHWSAAGDPTEAALVVAAAQFGLNKDELETVLPRTGELPFDSERKMMTTVHRLPDGSSRVPGVLQPAIAWIEQQGGVPAVAFTKGAVDQLISCTQAVWVGDHSEPLNADWRDRIENAHRQLAARGMRILGIAFRPLHAAASRENGVDLECDMIFIGMVGIIDPIRPEAKAAVLECKAAGIRPVMITGDHPVTALAIARDLQITSGDALLTGNEFANLTPPQLSNRVEDVAVYARVAPEQKLTIVTMLQEHGEIVAMTGDGVNDAAALKQADIGVAMGRNGTDVAKEAADMVLLDDNFATIVAAVEEGRTIYENIRRFIKYILTGNVAEIWVMLVAPLIGMPLPLLPLQILWINLLTDGLPGLALSVDSGDRTTMRRPPVPLDEPIFGRGMGRDILWLGIVMGLISLIAGFSYWSAGNVVWQTVVFTTITFSQIAFALALHSERAGFFRLDLRSNPALVGALLVTLFLQLLVVYLPALQSLFKTVALPAEDLIICLALSMIVFWFVKVQQVIGRRFKRDRQASGE